MQDAELTERLVAAQRNSSDDVDPAPYSALDRATAYGIQDGVMAALGQSAAMLKTAIHADGVGVVAPIFASGVGRAPGFNLPSRNVLGLEVEVGLVLGTDLPSDPSLDAARVAAAVDHYFLGVEVCGSRYRDRKAAGANGGLADFMSGLGYVIGPKRGALADVIEGLDVHLAFAGNVIHAAPARHAFGTVLASLIAYAKGQRDAYPLKSGTIVTTGSLCGLVSATGPGHVVARLGDESLEFDLT
jgi:2-keto-4-pentenoate hydratase